MKSGTGARPSNPSDSSVCKRIGRQPTAPDRSLAPIPEIRELKRGVKHDH
jgi:hypothetical protein